MPTTSSDSPIQVRRLTVRNFRCFENLSLDFDGHCSLVGENGSGKTAVLEALYFVLAPYTGTARFNEQDFNNKDAGPIEIEVEFSRPFTAKLPDGYQQRDVQCEGVGLTVRRREKAGPGRALNDAFTMDHWVIPDPALFGRGPQWKLTRKTGTDFQFSVRSLAISAVDLDAYPSVQYFGKTRERQASGGYNTTLQRILDELGWRYRRGVAECQADVLDAWERYYNTVFECVDCKKRATLLDTFHERSRELLGDSCDDVEIALLRTEEPFSKGFLARRDGLNQVDLAGMGSGVAMIITLALLETIAVLDKSDLIVLVDEPELHLHPQLQGTLRRHIEQQDYQVIFSTHSPLMVNLGDWRSVRRFDRHATVHPSPEALCQDVPQDGGPKSLEEHLNDIGRYKQHVSVLMRENNELLFARACVLVEGPIDKYAIETLSQVLGTQLDALTVIPCYGKTKIAYYQVLCRAYGVPYFTVWDTDSGDDKDNERVELLAPRDLRFAFRSSLEEELGIKNGTHSGARAIREIDRRSEHSDVPDAVRELIRQLARFQDGVLGGRPSRPESLGKSQKV